MLASKVSELCGVLSNPTRYNILKSLVTAGETGLSQRGLSLKLAISRASLKRHIEQLEKVGLVNVERQTRAVIYRANPNKLADFLDTLTRNFQKMWVLSQADQTPGDKVLPSLRERLESVLEEDNKT